MDLTVVKVGGSLSSKPKSLIRLLEVIGEVSKKWKIVIVPGGAEFADTVRRLDSKFGLSKATSHRMAVLAMDQYGMMLADLLPSISKVCEVEDAEKILKSGGLPLFLPSKLIFSCDPLENTWDVTSDSIALYVAASINASNLLLVTDVDGIFTRNPKTDKTGCLIDTISPDRMLSLGRTSVDKAFPKLLKQYKIDCYVLNGLEPNRIKYILNGQKTVCTMINDC